MKRILEPSDYDVIADLLHEHAMKLPIDPAGKFTSNAVWWLDMENCLREQHGRKSLPEERTCCRCA
jgi:hypothetical protein